MWVLDFNYEARDNVHGQAAMNIVSTFQGTDVKRHVLTVQRTEKKETKMDSRILNVTIGCLKGMLINPRETIIYCLPTHLMNEGKHETDLFGLFITIIIKEALAV